jgi:hypothetical protein
LKKDTLGLQRVPAAVESGRADDVECAALTGEDPPTLEATEHIRWPTILIRNTWLMPGIPGMAFAEPKKLKDPAEALDRFFEPLAPTSPRSGTPPSIRN